MIFSEESTPATSPHYSRFSTPGTDEDTLFDVPSRLSLNTKYILVTGGLGFIGSHTVLELLKAGHNVVIVDDLSNSFSDVFTRILQAANLHFDRVGGSCPKAIFHNVDYRDMPAMQAILDTHAYGQRRRSNIVGIIHFAAYKAVEESIRHPMKYYKNNINGLVDFLVLLDDYNIKTFIFSSSAAVYGNLADGRSQLREEHCVHDLETFENFDGTPGISQSGYTGITSPYGRTKYFGEAILSDMARSDPSWNIIALRYFNPVGCDVSGLLGEDPKGVPSNLLPVVVKVLTGELPELSVYGNDWDTPDGTAIRDFIHVSDLAKGHSAALFAAQAGKVRKGFRTFNLGAGTGYSVLDVVSTMESVAQQSIKTKIVSRRDGDVQACVAAADRASRELEWRTRATLHDACQDTWNFLKIRGL